MSSSRNIFWKILVLALIIQLCTCEEKSKDSDQSKETKKEEEKKDGDNADGGTTTEKKDSADKHHDKKEDDKKDDKKDETKDEGKPPGTLTDGGATTEKKDGADKHDDKKEDDKKDDKKDETKDETKPPGTLTGRDVPWLKAIVDSSNMFKSGRRNSDSSGGGDGLQKLMGALNFKTLVPNLDLAQPQEMMKKFLGMGMGASVSHPDDCFKEVLAVQQPLEKYIFLRNLQREDPEEFYKCLSNNLVQLLPIVYKPGVTKAVKNFKTVVSRQHGQDMGFTLNIKDHKDSVEGELQKWKKAREDVKLIVVTDGGDVEGEGDMGANAMGIVESKLTLYTTSCGIPPEQILPVTLDVGTSNKAFLEGKKKAKYIGKEIERVTGEEYDTFVDNFVRGSRKVFGPNTLIEFVDFASENNFALLRKHQKDNTIFIDDIQGFSAVLFSGIINAVKQMRAQFLEEKVLFVGTNAVSYGLSALLAEAKNRKIEDASHNIYMTDEEGLITSQRCPFEEGDMRKYFCHEVADENDTESLQEIILWLEPTMLIGVSGNGGIFTKEVLQNMAKVSEKNKALCFIMPFSGPKPECTSEEANEHAEACYFVEGPSFAPVCIDETTVEVDESHKESDQSATTSKQENSDDTNPSPSPSTDTTSSPSTDTTSSPSTDTTPSIDVTPSPSTAETPDPSSPKTSESSKPSEKTADKTEQGADPDKQKAADKEGKGSNRRPPFVNMPMNMPKRAMDMQKRAMQMQRSTMNPENMRRMMSLRGRRVKKQQDQCDSDLFFPGVTLGIVAAKMRRVPDRVFLTAAQAIADECVKPRKLFPDVNDLGRCIVTVAAAIVKYAFKEDFTTIYPKPEGWKDWRLSDYTNFVEKQQNFIGNVRPPIFQANFERGSPTDCVRAVDAKKTMLDKYIYLRKLQVERERMFYRCVANNVEIMVQVIYTPGVGKACKNYAKVEKEGGPIGLTLNIVDHKNKIESTLDEWKKKQSDVRAIVVTDGQRILGLGDLGANGMGIAVGKMSLYTALGGVDPSQCLPVTLDVGTDNEALRNEKKDRYVGKDIARVKGQEYDEFVDEFVKAVAKVYGQTTLIQFEDFGMDNAQPLLEKYRDQYTVFNDDIQGTSSVTLAGILAAAKLSGKSINDFKFLIVGAGSAALGISNLLLDAMKGNAEEDRKKIMIKDKYGLLTDAKCGDPVLKEGDKRRQFCHKIEGGKNTEDLVEIIKWFEPNVLIGVSTARGIFTKEVLETMAKVNKAKNQRPIIMPLSNPNSKSECTAEEAYKHAPGCIFASGSPFQPFFVDENTLKLEEHTEGNKDEEEDKEDKGGEQGGRKEEKEGKEEGGKKEVGGKEKEKDKQGKAEDENKTGQTPEEEDDSFYDAPEPNDGDEHDNAKRRKREAPGNGENPDQDSKDKGSKEGKAAASPKQDNDAGNKKQDSNDGNKKQDSNDGNKKQDSNDGNKKQDSNDGIKKQDSNDGNKKQDSNDGNKKQDSNDGNKKQDSNVGNKKQDSNDGNKKQDSNVGNKKQDSNNGNKKQGDNDDSSKQGDTDGTSKRGRANPLAMVNQVVGRFRGKRRSSMRSSSDTDDTKKEKQSERKQIRPSQCNNDNIFPGVAFGVILAKMKKIPDRVFVVAAETLAYKCLKEDDIKKDILYPPPSDLKQCSVKVAAAIVHYAFNEPDLSAIEKKPPGWDSWSFEQYERWVLRHQYRT